jgi:glutamyl-tRNA synthetase
MITQTVRTRIAPSPTGENLHIGNLYTALLNFAFAKKHNGKFIVRIEDTDRERLVPGAEERILQALRAFNLSYDEGPDIGGPYAPYRQSERLPIYMKHAELLIEKGAAYYCFCTKERLVQLRQAQQEKKLLPRYDKYCLQNVKNPKDRLIKGEKFVIRLNVPANRVIHFNDVLRGKISFDSNMLDDQVLIKSDGYPTYHMGVVVDDHLMGITHVIRAEEWISSTPKHVILYESFGWELPVFAHVPILRNPDRSKLSKRKNPVWVSWYLDQGYLPEAILNYLALMGWSHPEEKEFFSLQEFTTLFDLKDVKPVGPIFDLQKLTWMNQQYIQNLKDEELVKRILEFYKNRLALERDFVLSILPLVRTRMEILGDFEKLTAHFLKEPKITPRSDTERLIRSELAEKLAETSWQTEFILATLRDLLKKYKIKMSTIYYLITGEESGLPLPESLVILGKEKTLKRLSS